MFWKKIILDGFIPFSHVGNTHVEVEFDKPATCILGTNGCGKSSMLREMNPLPSTRSNYAKNGYVQKVLEHDGHIFTLTSDFKNPTSPHSFKKDDVELNLSGTSEVQKDLVEEHFKLNSLVNQIVSGDIHICSMQKANRKNLFSSTYPGDLSFVLEYHKKVCSQIRAFGNQIKLLQSREGALMSSLINEEERKRMTEFKNAAIEMISRIDKVNLLLENEITNLKRSPWLQKSYDEELLDRTVTELIDLRFKYCRSMISNDFHRNLGESVNKEDLIKRITGLSSEMKYNKELQSKVTQNLQQIRNELDKFTRLRDAPVSDKKDDLVCELGLLKNEMERIKNDPGWQDVPSIREEMLNDVEALVPVLASLLHSLAEYTGKLVSPEEMSNLTSKLETLKMSIADFNQEASNLKTGLDQMKTRRSQLGQNSYPQDCGRVCGLKATLLESLRDMDLRIAETQARYDNALENARKLTEEYDLLKKQVEGIAPALPIMAELKRKLSEKYLDDLVLNGETYLELLNQHPWDLTNRIVQGIQKSRTYYSYKALHNKAEAITHTLAVMDTSDSVSMSAKMIDEILAEKENQLSDGIKWLSHVEAKISSIESDISETSEVLDCMVNLDKLIVNATVGLNNRLIRSRIEFDEMIIGEHTSLKEAINTKLRNFEYILNEQETTLNILDKEVRPTLRSLREQKKDWELMESALSPTKGLPCIYLIRFMNRLFALANAYISEVWYCDMELAYLDETKDLDFEISVILNKSTVVPDISLCSKGQQAMIDLAMTLALCSERKFFDYLPLKCDEVDAALTPEHRSRMLGLISKLIEEREIKQMFLVNHYAIQTGLSNCDIVALSTDEIVLPSVYNEHAVIS